MKYPLNFIGIKKGFKKGSHNGIDFGWNSTKGGANVPIYAVDDGVVIYNRHQITGGYVIHIRHDNGYVSEYGHLLKDSQKVHEGDKVKKGQQIANMGKSGICAGEHLHFGLYKGTSINYNKNNFVDPINYLCVYSNQELAKGNDSKYVFYKTKIVKNVPSEPLLIRDEKNKIVGQLYNGNESEYYGKNIKGRAVVDKIKNYTTVDKYLK